MNVVGRLDRTRRRVRRGIGTGVIFFSFSLGVVMLLGDWGEREKRGRRLVRWVMGYGVVGV